MLTGKILITGGTGSLGTAILERARKNAWPATFTILARGESRMRKVLNYFPEVRGEIGDVRDARWLSTIFPGHDLVIHAAAIKQVPTAEVNVREAILTNTHGSINVAQVAVESGVPKVIGISTDKACFPTTIYGHTKALLEGIFREANNWSERTNFYLVRYGNVINSNASVIPLFKRQIEEDVPFTITDRDMTRFWLTMDQAIDLICGAISRNVPGTILVPKAPASTLIQVARALDAEREIKIIGIRPGEKVHEHLIHSSEAIHTVEGKDHFVVYSPTTDRIKNVRFWMQAGDIYTSASPARWLSKDAILKMIEESPESRFPG